MDVGLKVTDQPQESSFFDLVSGDNVLSIPLFQRPYRWSERNLDWLLADIDDIKDGSTKSCFLGVIVCVSRGASPGRPIPWEIVDGQQRLTTLYLLLLAATEVAAKRGAFARAAGIVGTYLLVRPLGDTVSNTKLQPSFADRAQFKRIWDGVTAIDGLSSRPEILANPPRPPSPSGPEEGPMTKQFAKMRKRIAKLWDSAGEDAVADLVLIASSKLSVVSISLRDPLVAPKIFERLNNRAELVTVADLVRNEVFASASSDASNADYVFSNQWEPFNEAFRENGLERFLFPYGLIINRMSTKADLFQNIREHWRQFESPSEVIADMRRFVGGFMALEYGQEDEHLPVEVRRGLARLSRLGKTSSTYCFLMQLAAAVREEKVPASSASAVIDVIESFLFRRAVCGIEPTGLHAAFKVLWTELTASDGYSGVTASAVQSVLSSKPTVMWPNDSEFAHAVRFGNLYSRKVCQYALAEFEASREGESPQDSFEVEHICPQTETAHWEQLFGDRYDQIVHAWANLLPITRRMNGRNGQDPFASKRTEYGESIFASAREVARQFSEWTPATFDARAEAIAGWAMERWPHSRVGTASRA